MSYLVGQIVLHIVTAAVIGCAVGWGVRARTARAATAAADERRRVERLRAEEQADDLRSRVREGEARADELNANVTRLEKAVTRLMTDAADTRANLTAESEKLRARLAESETLGVSLRSEIAALESRAARTDSDLARARESVETLTAEREALRVELDGTRSQLASMDDAAREREAEIRARDEDLRQERARREADAATGRRNAERLEAELAASRSDVDAARCALDALRVEIAEKESHWRAEADRLRREASPPTLVAPRVRSRGCQGDGDDLTRMPGIGPKIARLLNRNGIHLFRQIARWSADDIEAIARKLPRFRGRILRDDWIAAAREQHLKKYGQQP